MRLRALALAVVLGVGFVRPASADPGTPVARFALVIGNNLPERADGQPLRYADDDAVAIHRLLVQAGVDSVLLVTPDEDTRRMNPRLQPQGAPRERDLDQEFAALAARMHRLAERGTPTELFVFYSGHGDVDAGEGYVVLEDGRLTRTKFYELLSRSPATTNHVFVDACKSYFLAFDKGPGGRREAYGLALGQGVPAALDNTGFVLSTSSDRDSHEWERYQAGVLSHELRSGLRGAADADGDGRVTYAELGAFLATANANIANPNFRPDVLVRPPARDLRREVLSWLPDESAVRLEGGALGHVYVETPTGERVLDANPVERQAVTLHVPDVRPLYVRRNDGTAEHVITTHDPVTIASLERVPEDASKGALHVAFGNLFAAPFGPRSVAAYVLDAPVMAPPAPDEPAPRTRRSIGLVASALAAGAAGGALATGLLSLDEYAGGASASQADIASRNRAVRSLDVAAGVLLGWRRSAGRPGCGRSCLRTWPCRRNRRASAFAGGSDMGRRTGFVFALAAWLATGCQRELEGAPCPCAEGYRCSAATQTCFSGPETQTIDDLKLAYSDGPGLTGTYWYTYSDRTKPNSAPVDLLDAAPGSVSTQEGKQIIRAEPERDPNAPVVGDVAYPYYQIDGGGESLWGVGFGLDFRGAPPDGGVIPVNECGEGIVFEPDAGIDIPQPFDATPWTGIQFYARSFAGPMSIEVHIDDDRTSPWGQVPLDAGGCNACLNGVAGACSDSFVKKDVTIEAGQWTLVRVDFASMHSGNFAGILGAAATIDLQHIYNVHFQMPGSPSEPTPPFSLGVTLLSFYR